MAGYIPRRFTCPWAVIHPSSNRVQCRLTMLIKANALITTLCRHPKQRNFCITSLVRRSGVWAGVGSGMALFKFNTLIIPDGLLLITRTVEFIKTFNKGESRHRDTAKITFSQLQTFQLQLFRLCSSDNVYCASLWKSDLCSFIYITIMSPVKSVFK